MLKNKQFIIFAPRLYPAAERFLSQWDKLSVNVSIKLSRFIQFSDNIIVGSDTKY